MMSWIRNSGALLLLLALVVSTARSDTTVIDLSKELEVGNINNPDAAAFEERLGRDIRRMLVLEHGEIVMEYERDNVKDGEIYNLFSATKTMMSVIYGALIESDDYDISLDDTLGDIFTEEYAWSNIENTTDIDCKQNVTIRELLTMTSGMSSGSGINIMETGFLNPFSIPNSMGKNLPESLEIPDCYPEAKGSWIYMENSNVLSYVLKEVTGMSPKEFVDANFFPALGINETDWEWDANKEGIQTSFSQMRLTGRQMAKIAQLYLQKGYSAPGKPLLSEEWVDMSLSKYAYGYPPMENWYGYLWHLYDKDSEFHGGRNLTNTGDVWCASGLFGQFVCLNYDTDRVVVIQRSNTVYDYDPFLDSLPAIDAFSKNFTFTAAPTVSPAPTESPGSGASAARTGVLSVAVAAVSSVLSVVL